MQRIWDKQLVGTEELSYIKESHLLQLRTGGEPFYLLQRKSSGSVVSGTGSGDWGETEEGNKRLQIWAVGSAGHPDTRRETNSGSGSITVTIAGSGSVRVYDEDDILTTSQFAVWEDVHKNVNLIFSADLANPTTDIVYEYTTLCSCVGKTSREADTRCSICYGTKWPGGYDQYYHDGTAYEPVNTILIRVPMVPEDVVREEWGRVITRVNRHWTTGSPAVQDFDIIVGTVGRNAGKRFEITDIYDSRLRGELLHREFSTILLEEKDIRYQVSVV